MTSLAVFADEVRGGLRQRANVIFALIFKEFRSRSGRSSRYLGMLWTFSGPILYAFVLGSMWTLIGRKDFYGVSPFVVMAVSVIPFMMVRASFMSIPPAIGKNMGLYGFPQVKPIDALLAGLLLQATLTLAAGGVLLLGLYWFAGLTASFPDPLAALELLGILLMMSIGIVLTVGVYSTISDTFRRVTRMMNRPLIFVSLVFHLGIQLPPVARYWVSWNPLADFNELLRQSTLGIPPMPEAGWGYTTCFSVAMLALGLMIYYANRHRVLLTE